MTVETDFRFPDDQGEWRSYSVRYVVAGGRISFLESPKALKGELKAMRGSRWDGQKWTAADCPANWFNIRFLEGENVYAPWEQPVPQQKYQRDVMPQQARACDLVLARHYQWLAYEMGTGKTLAAQEFIERSDCDWLWVGPKRSLVNIQAEFKKFGASYTPPMISYDALCRYDGPLPKGIVFDECHNIKGEHSKRSLAAQRVADAIRAKHGWRGFVVPMGGSPAPKSPLDWWRPAEITWPGYLREGSHKALEARLAFRSLKTIDGVTFWESNGWRDDENKCNRCGSLQVACGCPQFQASTNEVAALGARLSGLVVVEFAADCIQLPVCHYRPIILEPSPSMRRAAQAIAATAENGAQAHILLRELSDGFQYRQRAEGQQPCTHCHSQPVYDHVDNERTRVDCPACKGSGSVPRMVRTTLEIPCPKIAALKGLFEECEETGRIVVFAGFTAAVDRCVALAHEQGWDVVRCDGRGLVATNYKGEPVDCEPLDYWKSNQPRVAWIAHPESGGVSFTLIESRMVVFYSNSFKPVFRPQSIARILRYGQTRGVQVVDLIHLPTDRQVIESLNADRALEKMSLSECQAALAA